MTTKIHAVVDALGNPLRFILSPGQVSDITQAKALIAGLRHTTAVHLLEAGAEVNVIRGWLGHVSLDTTNRYAEINIRMKEAALVACAPPTSASAEFPRRAVWRDDSSLLNWLTSL